MKEIIDLSYFKPRPYQIPFLHQLFNVQKHNRYMLVWPRRSGKDLIAFYACVRKMIEKPTQAYFIYPTYSQGRKILLEGLDDSGKPLLDLLPKELIAHKNMQDMTIKLKNGSLFKIVGSEDPDRLVGTNASFMVFSEYSLQNPRAWQFLRQVVRSNLGTAIFIFTPRGANHAYDLYKYAIDNPEGEWWVSKLTVDDTKHISREGMAKERAECSEDLIQQEFYTSFSLGVQGSYYSKYLNQIRLNGQIGNVPWQPYHPVHFAVDIGHDDHTAIVFFQIIGAAIHVIDYLEDRKQGLEYYAKQILAKPYTYGKMLFPHDLDVTEFGSGLTRKEQAINMGLVPTILERSSVADGIEAVRATLPRCYFDETKCARLLKCLESYRQEYDEKTQRYKGTPLHDWASDGADAFRYMAMGLKLCTNTIDAQAIENMYLQTRYGADAQLPRPFQQPNYY